MMSDQSLDMLTGDSLAFADSEQRYRALVDQLAAGIAIIDLNRRFIQANEKYCQIVGYEWDELRTLRMSDITHPDDLNHNLELLGDSFRNGTNYTIEKRYIRKDGSIVWVNNSVSFIRDATGRAQSAIAVCVDVTERK